MFPTRIQRQGEEDVDIAQAQISRGWIEVAVFDLVNIWFIVHFKRIQVCM
jgi:hypothetical protein